jgi:hypothetical protein
MPILPKASSAITKGFLKSGSDNINAFLKAAEVDNLPRHRFLSGFQKPIHKVTLAAFGNSFIILPVIF